MREILITVTNNRIVASDDFAGYQGEHNATKLLFSLPDELVSDEYSYSVNLTLPDGITAATPLTNQELTITNTLTVNSGVLQVQLVITKDTELIYKSGTVNLVIKKSIIPNAVIGGGSGVTSAVVDDEGYLIITLTDGTVQNAGFVKGDKGEQGEQGSSYTLTDTDKQEVASKLSAEIIKGLIEHTVEALEIPEGTVKISDYQFRDDSQLRRVVAPDTLEDIGIMVFENCFRLTGVEGMKNVKRIGERAFFGCFSLTDLVLPETVEDVGSQAFMSCYSLQHEELNLVNCVSIANSAFGNNGCKSLKLSSKLMTLGVLNPFGSFSNLEFVDLGTDFNCNGLNLSISTKFSAETLVNMLNSLKDRTGETAYTLTLGTTNLAKLTDEQKAIATNKNWALK
ncbi:MAG: leucine-rich repeat domain-containing protein [Acutalibacteraceae bacterium]|nr:leucine-rich repeat domain-containing protein [Acutalibacteraceae bacterium]